VTFVLFCCVFVVVGFCMPPFSLVNVSKFTPDSDGMKVTYLPVPFINRSRPRFWFFALAACGGKGLDRAQVSFHAWQAHQSHWNREFSEESTGLNTLYLVFFFLTAVLVGVHCLGTYRLQQKLSTVLHPMLRLFLLLLLVFFLGVFCSLLHYGAYPQNGVGVPALGKLGSICAIVARCLFITLLLLLSKGWTIALDPTASGRLTTKHKAAVFLLVLCYFVLSLVTIFYAENNADLRYVRPGAGVQALEILTVVVWIAFAAWFTYETVKSYKNEDNPSRKVRGRSTDGTVGGWGQLRPPLLLLLLLLLFADAVGCYCFVPLPTPAHVPPRGCVVPPLDAAEPFGERVGVGLGSLGS
jgi:hypothetical protein